MSTALATLARAIMSFYGPDEAEIFVVDPHTELAQVVDGPHLGSYIDAPPQAKQDFTMSMGSPGRDPEQVPEPATHHGYVHREDQVRNMAAHIGSVLASRPPAGDVTQAQIKAGIRMAGAADVPIIDREETVQGWGSWQLRGRCVPAGAAGFPVYGAEEVGLHLIVGRRIGTWPRAAGSPLIDRLLRMRSARGGDERVSRGGPDHRVAACQQDVLGRVEVCM